MLFTNAAILWATTMLAGSAVFLLPNMQTKYFKIALSFSGAYLFSITIIHILPEIFSESHDIKCIGIAVLAGFFLQLILEFFSDGVEHGHTHHHGHLNIWLLLGSLSIHSLLEGTLLLHPSHLHETADAPNLIVGLVLHKLPESFALISVLVASGMPKTKAFLLLILFSLTSPFGLLMGSWVLNTWVFQFESYPYLFALVAGNFLQISTTIFFESNPEHRFKWQRLLVIALGVALALMVESL